MSTDEIILPPIDAYRRVTQVIECARKNNLAIRCIGAPGERTDMIHSFEGLWVVQRQLASETTTWVVDRDTTETVRNVIVGCRPDVSLIERQDSMFGVQDE